MDPNPYAAPRSDFNTDGAGGQWQQGMYWRSGGLLMAKSGAVLPPRCVKCNAAIDGPAKKRRLYWHHPAFFLFVLLNIFIYAVVAVMVRRSAEVTFGLCQEHRRIRRRWVLIGLGAVLGGIALVVASATLSQSALVLAGLLVIVVGIVVSAAKAQPLVPLRIDRTAARLKGCGQDFLATLPGSSGQP